MSVENLQKVVGFGLQLGECIMSAMAASSNVGKIAAMIPLAEDVPQLIGVDFVAVKAEIMNLSPADLDQLNSYIDANFSIPDADKQAKVDAAVGVVIDLVKVVEKAVALCKGSSQAAGAAAVASSAAPASSP